jgi:hypothetical protein
VLPGEPIDDSQDRSGRRILSTPDPQFARCRIGEEFDVFDALSQLIENRKAAPDDGAAIMRRLDAERAAIKEAHTERTFKITNRP